MRETQRYLDMVDDVMRQHPDQREGQAYYNAFRMGWPGLIEQLPGDLDPYSLDSNLPGFLEWVEQTLDDQ